MDHYILAEMYDLPIQHPDLVPSYRVIWVNSNIVCVAQNLVISLKYFIQEKENH